MERLLSIICAKHAIAAIIVLIQALTDAKNALKMEYAMVKMMLGLNPGIGAHQIHLLVHIFAQSLRHACNKSDNHQYRGGNKSECATGYHGLMCN